MNATDQIKQQALLHMEDSGMYYLYAITRALFLRCAINVGALSISCTKTSMWLAAYILQVNIHLGKFPASIEINVMLKKENFDLKVWYYE